MAYCVQFFFETQFTVGVSVGNILTSKANRLPFPCYFTDILNIKMLNFPLKKNGLLSKPHKYPRILIDTPTICTILC